MAAIVAFYFFCVAISTFLFSASSTIFTFLAILIFGHSSGDFFIAQFPVTSVRVSDLGKYHIYIVSG